MNYFRIETDKEEAFERLCEWMGKNPERYMS